MTDPTTAARDALLADAKRAIDAPDVFWTLMGRSIDALIATVEAKRSAEVAALVEALVEARWRYDHPNGIKACSDCKACGGAWDEHDPDGGECPVQWVLAALAQTPPTDAGRLECLCHCHHDGGPCDRRECSRNFRPAPAPVTEPVSRTNGKVREHDFCCYYQHEFGQSCLLPDPFVLTVTYGPDTAPAPVTEDALAGALHRAEIDCWPDVDGCAASGHRGAAYRLRAAIPAPEPSSGAAPVEERVTSHGVIGGWEFEPLTGDGWAITPPPGHVDEYQQREDGTWSTEGYGCAVAMNREDAVRIVYALNVIDGYIPAPRSAGAGDGRTDR